MHLLKAQVVQVQDAYCFPYNKVYESLWQWVQWPISFVFKLGMLSCRLQQQEDLLNADSDTNEVIHIL